MDDKLRDNEYDAIITQGELPRNQYFQGQPLLINTVLKYVTDDNKIVGLLFKDTKARDDHISFMEDYQQELFNLRNEIAGKIQISDHQKADDLYQARNVVLS